jgi:nitric oxide reductase subunit B
VDLPFKTTFWFLMSTAFWNLFGAGVLGFLINLPIVSYFEHGSFLTATHGHGALMGVYGMLALALMTFTLRGIVKPKAWKENWLKVGFWGLNLGLMGMIVITLLPVGMIQMQRSFTTGFWAARSLEFYQQGLVHKLLWLRILPDSVFILFGVLPIVGAVIYAYLNQRPANVEDGEDFESGSQIEGEELELPKYVA